MSRTGKQADNIIGLAGWLFADMLLALAMIFLIANQSAPLATAAVQTAPAPGDEPIDTPTALVTATLPVATATQAPTDTPTVTPPPQSTQAVGLDLLPACETVLVNPEALIRGDAFAAQNLTSQFETKMAKYIGRRAGFIIALGYHSSLNIRLAYQSADKAISVLKEFMPDVFGEAKSKPFWFSNDVNHPIGTVSFEMYFYNDSGLPTLETQRDTCT